MSTFERIDPDPSKSDYLPYAPAVVVPAGSEYFFLSGATGIPLYHAHPHIPEECVLPDDIREQTRRVLDTFTDVLAFNGMGWRDVVKFSQFLTDLRDHDAVQEVIAEYFIGTGWMPASTVVGINALSAPGARLEIDVVAARSGEGN